MSATSFITQRNFLYKSLCAFFVLHFQYTFYYDLFCRLLVCISEFREKYLTKASSANVLLHVKLVAFKLRNLLNCRSHHVLSAHKLW